MSGDVIFQSFMGNLPALITSIGGLILLIRNGRKSDRVGEKVDAVHDLTNGTNQRMAQDLTATRTSAATAAEAATLAGTAAASAAVVAKEAATTAQNNSQRVIDSLTTIIGSQMEANRSAGKQT